ncbi:MAG: mechanosensitive ion channel [Bacillota bacterium]|nr:mechanosensitive ion channel [Bacillota bacterium]
MSKKLNQWLFAGQIENQMLLDLIDLVLTLVILYLVAKIISYVAIKLLKKTKINEKVLKTTINLIKNVINVVFVIMALVTILDFFGVNTSSLIATAGIGGVALAFGAQSLVKDVISGLFILIEGQYYIGDEVVIQGISANVVDFTLRTTKVQDFDTGAIHFIPNGSIEYVENRSKANQIVNLTVDIPNDYDPALILEILRDKLEGYQDPNILLGPDVKGISAFKDRYFSILILTTVKNGLIYEYQRKLRAMIAEALKENDISLYHPIINIQGDK